MRTRDSCCALAQPVPCLVCGWRVPAEKAANCGHTEDEMNSERRERAHRERREAEEYRDGAALIGARNAAVVTSVIVLAVIGALWIGGAL